MNPNEEKVLLITKEHNENVHLAGRNVEKLYLNTADAIKVRRGARAAGPEQRQRGKAGADAQSGPG